MITKDKVFFVIFVPIWGGISWMVLNWISDFFNSFKLLENKIVVDGAITTASIFATSFIFIPVVILFFISLVLLIMRINLKLPPIFFKAWLGFVVGAFSIGWVGTSVLRGDLLEAGYVECKDERKLSSRYSSQTYVINLELCQK